MDRRGDPCALRLHSLPEPVPAADKVSRRIRRYYQLQCRSFLRYCETYLLPAAAEEYRAALAASLPLPHFRAELTYQVTYNDGGLWSLYTQSRESGFSGRPTLLRHGDTWDLTSGYPVPLSAFFPRRSGWKRRLMEAAEAEIQRQETAGISRYHEGVRRLLRRPFQPAELLSYGGGSVVFLSHVRHRPGHGGHPVSPSLRPGGPALPAGMLEETLRPELRVEGLFLGGALICAGRPLPWPPWPPAR